MAAAVLVTTLTNCFIDGVRAGRGTTGIGIRRCIGQQQFVRQCTTNNMAFIHHHSPSLCNMHMRGNEKLEKPALIQSNRCFNIHTTTKLLMARKRNGGKKKKTKLQQQLGMPKSNSQANDVDDDGSSSSQDIQDILDASNTDQEELTPEFTATYASEYHAPVMPSECIDALLQQGEFGQLLQAKKDKWRKKRSIINAKRRKAGYLEDDEEDTADKGGEASSDTTTNQHHHHQPRLFIDGTLGGGGHSQALLQQLNVGDILIGCDVDPEALSTASTRLSGYLGTSEYILSKSSPDGQVKYGWEKDRPMFIPVQSNFRNLVTVLSKVRHPVTGKLLLGDRGLTTDDSGIDGNDEVEFPSGVNGMLLDLGVSSHQIDTSERGFAFMKEGPLDMRMSGTNSSQSSGLTAADICNEFDEATIIDILRTYGDEPRAKRLAAAIVALRPLHTTTDLVHAINSVTPTFARQKRAGLIATSARVFQALRIVVNEEDSALKEVLEGVAPWALARSGSHFQSEQNSGAYEGILAVLSYHSMEDKMAKRVIRDGKVDLFEKGSRKRKGALERDLYGNVINDDGGTDSTCLLPFEPLSKPRKANAEEIATNSRARSATLRVAIRI